MPQEEPTPSRGLGGPNARLETELAMATVIDPVCGMRIEADDAAAIAEREGQTYYFCSEACRNIFVSAPSAHAAPRLADTDADYLPEQEVAERAAIGVE